VTDLLAVGKRDGLEPDTHERRVAIPTRGDAEPAGAMRDPLDTDL